MLYMVAWILAGLLLFVWVEPAEAQQAERPVFSPLGEATRDYNFGSLARLPDGRLFTWWAVGKRWMNQEDIDDPTIPQRAMCRWSDDDGRTWSEPELLFEFPRETGERLDGLTMVDSEGVLRIFGMNHFLLNTETMAPEDQDRDIWQSVSRDMGQTWSPCEDIDFGHSTIGWLNNVIELSSGRFLLPLAYLSARETGKFVATCIYSDDRGESWELSRSDLVVDSGRGSLESGACEPVVIEMEPGQIWMLIRTQTGYFYEAFSDDGGETWSEPVQSRFKTTNSPAGLFKLSDGRILLMWDNCTFGNLEDFRGDRPVIAAAISDDNGATWHGYREIARAVQSWALAYPFAAETDRGDVITYLQFGSHRLPPLDPDWLMETSVEDDLSEGMELWSVAGAEGVGIEELPEATGGHVLAMRKTSSEREAATSRNFPFGVRGRVELRMRVAEGCRGASIVLTDVFSLPPFDRSGSFRVEVREDGGLYAVQPNGASARAAEVPTDEWFTLGLQWDCQRHRCSVTLNGEEVCRLWQLLAPDLAKYPPNMADGRAVAYAPGICYLRLRLSAEDTDQAGLMVDTFRADVSGG
ncbi:MAG: sialidase family protein [Armatimonadota bacterium]